MQVVIDFKIDAECTEGEIIVKIAPRDPSGHIAVTMVGRVEKPEADAQSHQQS